MTRDLLLRVRRDEDGAMTAFGLFLLVLILAVGGLGLDYTNAIRVRTHLQVAADTAAHAAIVARQNQDEAAAKATAVSTAQSVMPSARYGDALTVEDIRFGWWDDVAGEFRLDPGNDDAVLVDTSQIDARDNSVSTHFLRFVGIDAWDIRRQSVFETYVPTCFYEGFVAEVSVDVTSLNHYESGFCIHGNQYVEVNNHNTYEPGVIVSMPDKRDLVLPNAGFEHNDGLEEALRDGYYDLRILERISQIEAGLKNPDSAHYRSYVTSSQTVTHPSNDKLDAATWQEGRIHVSTCNSPNKTIQIPNGTVLRNGVFITNCRIQFGQGAAIENVTLLVTNTSANSVSAAQGARLGANDNCAPGGGAQVVTMGGVNIPSGLEMYGGQILARDDVSFTSHAYGIEGASIVSGGHIYGTTNSRMAFCNGSGLEGHFLALYFRMAA